MAKQKSANYGNIQTRVNLGAMALSELLHLDEWNDNNRNKWKNISNTLSRNINSLKSEFTVGNLIHHHSYLILLNFVVFV